MCGTPSLGMRGTCLSFSTHRGLTQCQSVADVLAATTPGSDPSLQGFLTRLLLRPTRKMPVLVPEEQLIRKFVNFISVKGEDLLLLLRTQCVFIGYEVRFQAVCGVGEPFATCV